MDSETYKIVSDQYMKKLGSFSVRNSNDDRISKNSIWKMNMEPTLELITTPLIALKKCFCSIGKKINSSIKTQINKVYISPANNLKSFYLSIAPIQMFLTYFKFLC